jgi:hypothetical protein
MIIDPAIWNVPLLIRMVTECRVYGRSDPEDPGWLVFPPWVDATFMRLIHLIGGPRKP